MIPDQIARDLRQASKDSHIRSLVSHQWCVTGAQQEDIGMGIPYFVGNHMVIFFILVMCLSSSYTR